MPVSHAKPAAATDRKISGSRISGGSVRLEREDPQVAPASGGGNAAGSGPMRFSGVAYTGAVVPRWYGALVIDLAGLEMSDRGRLPCLLEHGWCGGEWCNVGVIDTIENDGKQLRNGGKFLTNESASKVSQDLQDGFPWEQSICVDFLKVEELGAGVTEQINGRSVSGPCVVVRASRLREISFVKQGADADTETELEQLSALGFTPDAGRIAMSGKSIDIKALTVDQLKAERPDIIAQIGGKGVDTSTPATFAQLKAIDGADPAFIVDAQDRGLTLAQATEALASRTKNEVASLKEQLSAKESEHAAALKAATDKHASEMKALNDKLKAAEAAAGVPGVNQPKPQTPADKAVFSGTEGKDAEKDWETSAELRANWKDKKGAFLSFARDCDGRGEAWNKRD